MKKTLFLLLFTLLFAVNYPELTGRVVDEAHILSPACVKTLNEKLKNFEKNTSNQIVVVTLNSLQGKSIENYGYKLGRKWGIGQKNKNNGVLLIIAPNEKKVRIEVGYGLEGELTDAKAFLIINDIIVPYFKKGDFDTGVTKGVEAIIQTVKGTFSPGEKTENYNSIFFFLFIFLYSLLQKYVYFLRKRANKIIPSLFFSFFVYLLSSSLVLSAAAFGILYLIFSFFVKSQEKTPDSSSNLISPDGNSHTHNTYSSSNNENFTGGGGSFGGGGSSGSW
jgi:uncharacterized protein